jgi:hypothetical protein
LVLVFGGGEYLETHPPPHLGGGTLGVPWGVTGQMVVPLVHWLNLPSVTKCLTRCQVTYYLGYWTLVLVWASALPTCPFTYAPWYFPDHAFLAHASHSPKDRRLLGLVGLITPL